MTKRWEVNTRSWKQTVRSVQRTEECAFGCFVFGGLHCDEIVTVLRALRFGGHFEVHFGGGCGRSVQCDVGFGCQHSICCGTEENLDRVDRSFVLRST